MLGLDPSIHRNCGTGPCLARSGPSPDSAMDPRVKPEDNKRSG